VPAPRDKFSNLERMRREIDDLFDDVWARAGFPRRHRAAFKPRVDVYYCGKPSKAIVEVELAGVDSDSVNLELRRRTLIVSGVRTPSETEGRVYQQLEIERGDFAREISLGADVDAEQAHATYEDGILRIELPILAPKGARKVRMSGEQSSE
jgi:HSP20 family protein